MWLVHTLLLLFTTYFNKFIIPTFLQVLLFLHGLKLYYYPREMMMKKKRFIIRIYYISFYEYKEREIAVMEEIIKFLNRLIAIVGGIIVLVIVLFFVLLMVLLV